MGLPLLTKNHFANTNVAHVSDENKIFEKNIYKSHFSIFVFIAAKQFFLHVSDHDKQKNVIEFLNFLCAGRILNAKIKMLPDKGVHLCSETPKLGGSTVYI